jgi:hypothetical protein
VQPGLDGSFGHTFPAGDLLDAQVGQVVQDDRAAVRAQRTGSSTAKATVNLTVRAMAKSTAKAKAKVTATPRATRWAAR